MKANDDFILRTIYGKHILFPIRKNDISSDPIMFNDIAAYMWTLINEKYDRNELLREISVRYSLEDNSEELTVVEEFLNKMININLIYE